MLVAIKWRVMDDAGLRLNRPLEFALPSTVYALCRRLRPIEVPRSLPVAQGERIGFKEVQHDLT